MITLIGARCKSSNGLSRGVLIRPFPLGNLRITFEDLIAKCIEVCELVV